MERSLLTPGGAEGAEEPSGGAAGVLERLPGTFRRAYRLKGGRGPRVRPDARAASSPLERGADPAASGRSPAGGERRGRGLGMKQTANEKLFACCGIRPPPTVRRGILPAPPGRPPPEPSAPHAPGVGRSSCPVGGARAAPAACAASEKTLVYVPAPRPPGRSCAVRPRCGCESAGPGRRASGRRGTGTNPSSGVRKWRLLRLFGRRPKKDRARPRRGSVPPASCRPPAAPEPRSS